MEKYGKKIVSEKMVDRNSLCHCDNKTNGCINSIQSNPIININIYISDLNTTYFHKKRGEKLAYCDGSVNHIIIKPNICVTNSIHGLEVNEVIIENEDEIANESHENINTNVSESEECDKATDSINCIVVEPNIKVDTDISGLTTTITV
ncbi:hypothetical protein HZI73_22190 [Vallitalea pronyensis]|uniref:Uncharacterized protein n=1 Tax=Vallitalea pronyensis TaxID=1348613 RepID=A0A8J8MMW9_9FIRM|nr:hypothetical protein [Vallitalea pronyensis]QUI24842.1 hypothetical protein HZI73_22190 [Vallitalea pronyensis]